MIMSSFHCRRPRSALALAVATSVSLSALAAGDPAPITPFNLGEVLVTATHLKETVYGDQVASTIDQGDMRRFERNTVGEALDLLTGISVSTNVRNEATISIRGFDARQAPIFVDGIPVYVPYDGYVDLDRFVTGDLASIQVAKGMSSMMYGPNTLGGAINLVSRKPSAPFEGDVLLGVGTGNLQRGHLNVGTNQGLWYLQAGVADDKADYFRLSGDFRPTSRENGGQRQNSEFHDKKQSLKIGLTPNDTDEYALSYIKQDGQKNQPTTVDPAAAARYWDWPFWNKDSYYFMSNTQFGEPVTLRLRLYNDEYSNGLHSYTDATLSQLATSGSASVGATGISNYEDRTRGGSVQLESTRWDGHDIKLQYFRKNDRHREDDGRAETNYLEDDLISVAAEDYIELNRRLHLALGAGRDTLDPRDSGAYNRPEKQSANNGQIGMYFDLDPSQRLYATLARKSRLPTLKDRYSLRLGTFIENPDLRAEHATHYEIGYQGEPWRGASLEAAVFRSDIKDLIQRVRNVVPGRDQMQNVNRARYQGVEISLKQQFGATLAAGAGYTYLDRDNLSSDAKLTDTPQNKFTTWADWTPHPRVHLIGTVEYEDARWASDTVQLSGYTRLDVKATFAATTQLTFEAGVNNLSDHNYELADGFPEAGRTLYGNVRYQF
jgi:iron complex outermembrane receptor protein